MKTCKFFIDLKIIYIFPMLLFLIKYLKPHEYFGKNKRKIYNS